MADYLAIDLGAESGRIILGTLKNGIISLKELHRFKNPMLYIQKKYYWDIGYIYNEILTGIEICVNKEKVKPISIGIDTWGVDYGLLSADGTILGMPYSYRDPRTKNAIKEFTSIMPAQQLYNLTGTLLAPYNTIFQLFAAKKNHPEILNATSDLLFIPDLLTYFLTGEKKTEFSFATTSQLFNPLKKKWEKSLFDILDISPSIMQQVIDPATIAGYLDDEVCKKTGIDKIPFIAVCTHDTNSAVTAIPATEDNWAFISSGTWSLMGFESQHPVISDTSFSFNFTNEGGLNNTFQVLKNHMGLWLLQQCRKCWKNENYSYEQLMHMAEKAPAFTSFINADYDSFLNPPDMYFEISEYLKRTKQKIPFDNAGFVRIILESLALKYRETLEQINVLRKSDSQTIYITGGGANNSLLCQFTANATGKTVKTGMTEGTAAGNILTQAIAMKEVSSIHELRQIIRNSCNFKTYMPTDTQEWNEAYLNYKEITK